MKLRFRQKILISFLLIFLVFTLFMYPVTTWLTRMIQEHNLKNQTLELIHSLESASNFQELIERLKQREKFLFFRVSLIDPAEGHLYDSHRQIGGLDDEQVINDNEISQAISVENGYDVHFSPLFGQNMAYLAVHFTFQDKQYIMRAAFPYGQITKMTHDLTITFLALGIGVLLLFSFLAWFIIHILTDPVHRIIQAIKPYQLGEVERLSEIKLGKQIRSGDEFSDLAETLNSLSRHIDHQISTLTHEKNEKSAILESLVEGVVAVDHNMTVTYMNRMAEVFLNTEGKQLVGETFSNVHHPLCTQLIRDAQEKGYPVVLVIQPRRKQKRYLDVVAVPLGKGGAILVLQDKTSLHKVIELGRDFIANASHELKTPITIIRGFAETLYDHPELTKEVNKEITKKIVSNCQRMNTLVKNLLALAAVDEGLPRSRLQECDIYDLAEQAKHTLLTVHPDAEIAIEAKGEEPYSLLADSDLMYQAILNLLDNAIKYSNPPAKVMIWIEKYATEFLIKVSDRGVGIPMEDLDRIFERFYAVNKSHSRSLGGSGLGLSIVERIIEKHQGKIEVESKYGVGTTFTITLPICND